jgi:hypothetical protein
MRAIKLFGLLGVLISSLACAADGLILIQASSSENVNRSNTGNAQNKKSDSVVISTPKPRERVVPQAPQPTPPIQMPIVVLPTAPQR